MSCRWSRTIQSDCAGFVLIPVLFGMLLLNSLISLALTRAHAWAQGAVISVQADELFSQVGSYLISSQESAAICAPFHISSHGDLIEWIACREPAHQIRTFPVQQLPRGVPDYNEIFENITSCPGIVASNRREQFSAPAHPFTCLTSGVVLNNLTTAENISFTELKLVSQKRDPYRIISSLGEIRGEVALVTDTDLLILAGGDISIASIASIASGPVRVTILSAQGSVEVLAVDSQTSLLLAGSRRLAAPASVAAQGHPLPPFRAQGIRGVISAPKFD